MPELPGTIEAEITNKRTLRFRKDGDIWRVGICVATTSAGNRIWRTGERADLRHAIMDAIGTDRITREVDQLTHYIAARWSL